MSPQSLVLTVAGAGTAAFLLCRAWTDLMKLMYYREKMRMYVRIAQVVGDSLSSTAGKK